MSLQIQTGRLQMGLLHGKHSLTAASVLMLDQAQTPSHWNQTEGHLAIDSEIQVPHCAPPISYRVKWNGSPPISLKEAANIYIFSLCNYIFIFIFTKHRSGTKQIYIFKYKYIYIYKAWIWCWGIHKESLKMKCSWEELCMWGGISIHLLRRNVG